MIRLGIDGKFGIGGKFQNHLSVGCGAFASTRTGANFVAGAARIRRGWERCQWRVVGFRAGAATVSIHGNAFRVIAAIVQSGRNSRMKGRRSNPAGCTRGAPAIVPRWFGAASSLRSNHWQWCLEVLPSARLVHLFAVGNRVWRIVRDGIVVVDRRRYRLSI